ncbi:hypothetical protein VNO78_17263 [Psophocarpus tetragonolobus]|uniref:Uncharacterized protein n=1 Tax=Psophocarpus tetragonolobus TaxID=3891 RepID=A0AAN9SI75_PSOTE
MIIIFGGYQRICWLWPENRSKPKVDDLLVPSGKKSIEMKFKALTSWSVTSIILLILKTKLKKSNRTALFFEMCLRSGKDASLGG